MNPKLSVKFDNSDLLQFVQGEDRSFQLTFLDDTLGKPLNLTDVSDIQVNLPRLGGGTIKRRETGFLVENDALTIATGYISFEDHGLVDGETIRLTTSGVLPTGYALSTDYKIGYVDENTFTLNNATTDEIIKPTTQGTGNFTVSQQHAVEDGSDDEPVLGEITLNLPTEVTSQVRDSLGQGFQCQFLDADSALRIIVLPTQLDVVAQPAP